MQEKLKILIVRFSSIGDIVLTTPIVRILKNQLKAEIHYLTKSKYIVSGKKSITQGVSFEIGKYYEELF